MDTEKGSMAGPVENYVNSAANGSLIAAASALVAGGGIEDAAAAIEAGVPRAAHMGRQAFAAYWAAGSPTPDSWSSTPARCAAWTG